MTEIMEQQTTNEVVEQSQEQQDEDSFNKALQILGDDKLDEANKTEEVQETPKEEVKEEPQKNQDDDKSDYYARLIEKDKEIRALKSQLKGGKNYQQLAKEDPQKVLQELGIGIDQVIDMWSGNQETAEEDHKEQEPQNDKLTKLEQELEALRREKEEERVNSALQSEINKVKDKVLKDEENKWELIKNTNNFRLVIDVAVEMYKQDPDNPPDYNDVLDAVEHHLEDQYSQMYEQMSKINKIKSKFGLGLTDTETKKVETDMKRAPIGPTLGTSTSADTPTPRALTDEECFSNALKVLEQAGD